MAAEQESLPGWLTERLLQLQSPLLAQAGGAQALHLRAPPQAAWAQLVCYPRGAALLVLVPDCFQADWGHSPVLPQWLLAAEAAGRQLSAVKVLPAALAALLMHPQQKLRLASQLAALQWLRQRVTHSSAIGEQQVAAASAAPCQLLSVERRC